MTQAEHLEFQRTVLASANTLDMAVGIAETFIRDLHVQLRDTTDQLEIDSAVLQVQILRAKVAKLQNLAAQIREVKP